VDPVLHEKVYVFRGNPDERSEEITNSFYGIHLIQDSENEGSIEPYQDGVITFDNAIAGHSYSFLDHEGEAHYFYFEPRPVRRQTQLMKDALDYFTPLLHRIPNWALIKQGEKPIPGNTTSYRSEIRLSEIIAFFQQQGYTVLNIIDTGCRNVNDEKYSPERVPWLELQELMRGVANRTKKGRKELDPLLGKRTALRKRNRRRSRRGSSKPKSSTI